MKQQFIKYVSNNIAGMAGLSAYILADTFFIARCAGANGITVLNLAIPLYSLLFALGSMIGIGSATKFSILAASGSPERHPLFSRALIWQVLLGLPFQLLGVFHPELWLQWMGGDAAITALGRDYVRIVLLGAPVFMANYSFTAFTRNDGAPSVAMTASLIASSFNILFDYLFMFPFGMGIAGAALATAMAPGVSCLICCAHLASKKCTVHFCRTLPAPKELLQCCALGISAFVGEISSAVTTTVFNFLLLKDAGNLGVAAYGIVTNLALVAMAFFNGLSQGMQPLVSTAYGKGSRTEMGALLRMGIYTALGLEALVVGAAWCWTGPLTALFNSSADAVLADYSQTALRFYSLGFLPAGCNIVLSSYFAATGKTKQAFIASTLRGVAAIVFFAVVMELLWGMNGIWFSFLAAEAATLLVIGFMSRR